MELKKVKVGLHTIELYSGPIKYSELQKVVDHLTDQKAIQLRSSDPYNIDRRMKSSYFVNRGVTLRLYQSYNKSNGISFAINPSTLLSQIYRPLKLFKPTKSNVRDLSIQFEEILEEIQLSQHGKPVINPEDLSLNQIDLYFSEEPISPHSSVFSANLSARDITNAMT